MTFYLHNNGVIRDSSSCPGEGVYCTPRAVVVIDPENFTQVKRLHKAFTDAWGGCAGGAEPAMQEALRSLIGPPKPEEPTDPKACVTDRRDNIWRLLADGDWVCTSGPDIGEYLAWDGLTDRGPLEVTA